jgi:hypothetical protein
MPVVCRLSASIVRMHADPAIKALASGTTYIYLQTLAQPIAAPLSCQLGPGTPTRPLFELPIHLTALELAGEQRRSTRFLMHSWYVLDVQQDDDAIVDDH